MEDFKIGQKVKYKNVFNDREVTGSIHCIVKIVDHEDEAVIGKTVCFVRKEPGYCSDKVFAEDLELV